MTTYVNNKKVRFNYEILETFEAGLVLFGYEAKAVRKGKASLQGAHIIVRGREAYLVSATISHYQEKNTPTDYEPERPRKLLLSRKELDVLEVKEAQRGLTVVPLRLYNAGRNIKLEIAVARGKKKHDKRESLKARDTKRDIERTLKNQ